MGPVEALELALNQEIGAINIYRDLSLKYPQLKNTLSFLLNEEEKHKKLIETRISELKG